MPEKTRVTRDPRLVHVGDWIEQVNGEGVGLSAWELGFMDSITEQFDLTGRLSEAQIDIVERIYTERTP